MRRGLLLVIAGQGGFGEVCVDETISWHVNASFCGCCCSCKCRAERVHTMGQLPTYVLLSEKSLLQRIQFIYVPNCHLSPDFGNQINCQSIQDAKSDLALAWFLSTERTRQFHIIVHPRARSHRSIIRLLARACFTGALHFAYVIARSFTHPRAHWKTMSRILLWHLILFHVNGLHRKEIAFAQDILFLARSCFQVE